MNEDKERSLHPFLALPQEVRSIILNKVDQNTALNLRLVYHQLYDEVNRNFHFSIRLDDHCPILDKILHFRVKKLILLRFSQHLSPQSHTFQYPNFIQTLEIKRPEGVLSPIAPRDFYILLQSCAKYLKALLLDVEYRSYSSKPIYQIHFENLTKFDFLADCHSWAIPCRNSKEPNPEINIFDQIFGKSTMPKLKSLKVKMTNIPGKRFELRFQVLILKLIAGRGNGLESVVIDLHDTCTCHTTELEPPSRLRPLKDPFLTPSDLLRLNKVESLKDLKIWVGGDEELSVQVDLWVQLSANQKKLVNIDLLFTCAAVPMDLCRHLVHNNEKTLAHFALDLVLLDEEDPVHAQPNTYRPLELSMFRNCSSLRRLKLCSEFEYGLQLHGDYRPEAPALVGFSHLPQTLEELEVVNFCISTKALLNALSAPSTSNLKRLRIDCSGDSQGLGVDWPLCQAFLNKTSLEEVRIQQFNYKDPRDELNFQGLFKSLGFDSDHLLLWADCEDEESCFWITRESKINSGWRKVNSCSDNESKNNVINDMILFPEI